MAEQLLGKMESAIYGYFDWLNHDIKPRENEVKYQLGKFTLSKFFKKSSYKQVSVPEDIVSNYENVVKYLSTEDDLGTWLDYVKDFALFLRIVEKCFVCTKYKNSNLYSEIDKNKNIILQYKLTDHSNVKITFEKTKIKNPAQTNIALSMILDEDDADDIAMEFITIEVYESGEMQSKFRFVSNENIKFTLKSDRVLLDYIKYNLGWDMAYTFLDVINTISSIFDIDIPFHKIRKEGFWIN